MTVEEILTTMTTEQICFRYDGSEEAKKCIEWINETHQRSLCGSQTFYHSLPENGNFGAEKPRYGYRLVTPAEFLSLVSEEPEWTPKYGEEVEVSDDKETWNLGYYCCYNPHPQTKDEFPHVVNLVHTKHGGGGAYRYIRPIRKSVREEIANILMMPFFTADQILDIIKQRKDEL